MGAAPDRGRNGPVGQPLARQLSNYRVSLLPMLTGEPLGFRDSPVQLPGLH